MNQDEIKQILKAKYDIHNPEAMWARIVYDAGGKEMAVFNEDHIGVDLEVLEWSVNYDLERNIEDEHGFREVHGHRMTVDEIVWEAYLELLKESIEVNLL